MKENKFLLISLEDEKAKHLSGVLSNKTCKKIIDYLAENPEASEQDLSDKLNQPINTIEYNLKKLINSGLIEKSSNWFWSKKGKKIIIYKLSNKSIIISPRKTSFEKIKKILPSILISIIGAIIIKISTTEKKQDFVIQEVMTTSSTILSPQPTPIWIWFLGGAFLAILIFTIFNWRKI